MTSSIRIRWKVSSRPDRASSPNPLTGALSGSVADGPGRIRLFEDGRVRLFQDAVEMNAFARRETDHLGNLAGRSSTVTWLKFSPDGTTVISENHTEINLPDVLRADSRGGPWPPFLYENFPADDLSARPALRKMVVALSEPDFPRFGVTAGNFTERGADSIFPKIGWGLVSVRPGLADGPDFTQLDSYTREGQYGRYALLLAWARAQDLAQRQERTAAEEALIDVFNEVDDLVRPFLELIEPAEGMSDADLELGLSLRIYRDEDEFGIGPDAFDGESLPAPHDFVDTFTSTLREQVFQDPYLSDAQRQQVYREPDLEVAFAQWRNLSMAGVAVAGVRRGVRYIGMGSEHAGFLQRNFAGQIPRAHFYDLSTGPATDRRRFEEATWSRQATASVDIAVPATWNVFDVLGKTAAVPGFGGGPEWVVGACLDGAARTLASGLVGLLGLRAPDQQLPRSWSVPEVRRLLDSRRAVDLSSGDEGWWPVWRSARDEQLNRGDVSQQARAEREMLPLVLRGSGDSGRSMVSLGTRGRALRFEVLPLVALAYRRSTAADQADASGPGGGLERLAHMLALKLGLRNPGQTGDAR